MAEKIKAKWNWFSIMDQLANNDILKLEDVSKLDARMCFTYLLYKKETNEINK